MVFPYACLHCVIGSDPSLLITRAIAKVENATPISYHRVYLLIVLETDNCGCIHRHAHDAFDFRILSGEGARHTSMHLEVTPAVPVSHVRVAFPRDEATLRAVGPYIECIAALAAVGVPCIRMMSAIPVANRAILNTSATKHILNRKILVYLHQLFCASLQWVGRLVDGKGGGGREGAWFDLIWSWTVRKPKARRVRGLYDDAHTYKINLLHFQRIHARCPHASRCKGQAAIGLRESSETSESSSML